MSPLQTLIACGTKLWLDSIDPDLVASINVTIEFLAYRRLRRAPKLAPLITAVGMSFILLPGGPADPLIHALGLRPGRSCVLGPAETSKDNRITRTT